MAFTAINRQFTLAAFATYLATMPRPDWPRASTYHNTYKPTEADWRGLPTMQGMQAHYESLGWTTGPHCFLALHSPNPAHDGVWVMTPPTTRGTHAGACNADHFGIEVVGNFDLKPPSAAQQQLLVEVLTVLHRWAGLGAILDAHRDCMAGRTCPGDAFYALKPQLQARLALALQVADPLKARTLPGPPGERAYYCSQVTYDAYMVSGGFLVLGYARRDEYRTTGQNGQPCTVMPLERVTLKNGREYALQAEARDMGWIV